MMWLNGFAPCPSCRSEAIEVEHVVEGHSVLPTGAVVTCTRCGLTVDGTTEEIRDLWKSGDSRHRVRANIATLIELGDFDDE